jgi:hypothetical protein
VRGEALVDVEDGPHGRLVVQRIALLDSQLAAPAALNVANAFSLLYPTVLDAKAEKQPSCP